ncbi:MAG: hypothetical protein AAF433_10385 [Bacteroidota bacterium]
MASALAQDGTNRSQSAFQIGRWQLSGSITVPSSTHLPLSIITPDSARAHNNIFGPLQINFRPNRTIEVNGQSVDYFNDAAIVVTATDISSWYISSIGLHRQFASGFNVYGRLVYGRQRHTATVQSVDQLPSPNDGFIEVRRRITGFGLQFGVDYHFLKRSRLQPKLGIAYTSIRENTYLEAPYNYRIPNQDYEEAIAPSSSLENNSFRDERMVVNLGLLYRLLPRWSLGIECRDVDFFRDGFNAQLGLEIRYWYGDGNL